MQPEDVKIERTEQGFWFYNRRSARDKDARDIHECDGAPTAQWHRRTTETATLAGCPSVSDPPS
jgi:hypothetical protein